MRRATSAGALDNVAEPGAREVNGQPFGSAGEASTSSKFPRLVRDSSLSLLNSIPLRHQHD